MPLPVPLKTFAVLRMATGISLLALPRLTSATFLVPYASSSSWITRFGGVRDFAIGALLYSSRPPSTPPSNGKPGSNGGEGGVDSRELRRALMMGILVDAVDIMSCAVAYGEGSLPIEAVGLVAGGAALALGLGVWGLVELPAGGRN
jgi:hypothetical protein